MITGSMDCTIKLHDFAALTPNTLRAFKSVDPTFTKGSANSETHPVHVAKFNPNSPSQVLVISATTRARILSRDGETTTEFVKGDMYLRDMNMTKGHISEITTGTWHPHNYNLCVTAGTDSTLRIWDVNVRKSPKRRHRPQIQNCRLSWSKSHDSCCMGQSGRRWKQPSGRRGS